MGKEENSAGNRGIPESTDELRELIIKREREGVDVDEAWRLFYKARESESAEQEEERRKVPQFIEKANNALIRGESSQRANKSAFFQAIAAILLLLISVFLYSEFRTEASYIGLIFAAPLIAMLYVAKNMMTKWMRRIARKRRKPLETDRVPRDLNELLGTIIRCERKRINVAVAWGYYEKAIREENEGSKWKAAYYLERAYSELLRKEVLFEDSSSAFVVCIIALLISVVIFGLFVSFNTAIERLQILSVPLFVIAWGLTGSISYVLLSAYGKIKRKTFDWYDLPEYSYRFILGGVLAGIAFYVVQLGITSLPGPSGESVNAAVAGAHTALEFRDDYFQKEKIKAELEKCEYVYKELKETDVGKSHPDRLADFLIEYGDVWEKYRPGEWYDRISRADIEAQYKTYTKVSEEFGDATKHLGTYVRLLITEVGVKAAKEKEESPVAGGETTVVKSELAAVPVPTEPGERGTGKEKLKPYTELLGDLQLKTDLESKAELLKGNVPVSEKTEVPYEALLKVNDSEGVLITAEMMKEAINAYTSEKTASKNAASEIEESFISIEENTCPELEKKINRTRDKLKIQEEKVKKWRHIVPSVELEERYKKVSDEIKKLKGEIEVLNKAFGAKSAKPGDVGVEEPPELREKKLELEINEMELLLISSE
ncbi:MAG: hypothetical protein JSU81_03825, partial [Candidatus Coatesbacteria bacterium]